ncbi:secreted salivary gland peptide, putative [Ixodes scapularis]|uniref:Secreted salivary gland peptide, putative n=1 Tax=Ixodes scapularis TaxID=6945 RepID=B7QHK8_IXOSC|nr:secreted salivary gland peptide, putative [Ixodes scapularis]|eukprot:XP_002414665.1 secreted salivary gland peptide, putative [Ixodes scapularis]
MKTIVLWAVIALGGVSRMSRAAHQNHPYGVSFENGTCTYRNITLKDGHSDNFQYPCEFWTCNATAKTLTVEGCGVARYGSCRYVHHPRFYWPHCCRMTRVC